MMVEAEISAKEAAALCKVSLRTFRHWRTKSYGPPCFRVGGRLRYRPSEVMRWLGAQRDR